MTLKRVKHVVDERGGRDEAHFPSLAEQPYGGAQRVNVSSTSDGPQTYGEFARSSLGTCGEVFDALLAFVRASIEEHDAEMWSVLADPRLAEDRFPFTDQHHLNAEGAGRFGQLVAGRLLGER